MHEHIQGADYLAAKLDYINNTASEEEKFGDLGEQLEEYIETQKELISSIYQQSDRETTEYLSAIIQREPEKLVEETRKLEAEGEIEIQDFEYGNALVDLVIPEGENNE